MPLKGLAYLKTIWAFEERPVASAKLNAWDNRIENALELLSFLLNHAWGGGDGVLRGLAPEDLRVAARDSPGLSVVVRPGCAFIGGAPFRLKQDTETVDVAPPALHPRIDRVQARIEDWSIAIKTGGESASPVPPAPDPNTLTLARLYLRPGMSNIKNSDDTVNGYIIDERAFL